MLQPLRLITVSAIEAEGIITASQEGEGGVAAHWRALEASARLPTQLICFVAALAGTFLDEGVIAFAFATGAMLPLCRARGYFARWRIAGSREVFEPVDVICQSTEAARGLARMLAKQPRALTFDRIPAESELIPALRQAMKYRGLVLVRPAISRPFITLDESWSEPQTHFNSGRQSDFRRALRKAERHGEVTLEVLVPAPSTFEALFDEAVAVELQSWKKRAGSAMGVEPLKAEFFRRFFRKACEEGLLRIAFMRIDGRPVAMQMALEWADRFWLFKIGYDEEFRDCSPGNLLMLHTLAYAASRRLTTYELLGNIERWISDFWTKEYACCCSLRTYPANPRGVAAFAMDAGTWLIKRIKWAR